ncbi:MAG TPA: tetratricopeptide repeat protein, partial [Planctomycetota bacterium]|nr:tetratricopeptide repeat protein [Planctomycetota bacterium]
AFKNAETAFLVGEFDKAIEEFLSVGREFQDTSYRMKSVLRVGDVYYHQKKFDRAVSYYQRSLKVPAELWWPEESVEDYARADYMIGVCYFDQRSMDRAFAHFRRFVQKHPASKLLDRAYDFIGRGNMDMKRYGQAIEAFRMVGTASLGKQARRTVAPGEELYIRVVDADVGMATKHSTIPVRIATTAGDDERLDLKSLGIGSSVFLATIKTRLGSPRLTKSLDDAFSKERRKKIDDTVLASTSMDEEANELDKKLAAMEPPENTPENQEELKKFDAEKARLKERIASLRDGAVRLREQAYGDLSTAFAKVEDILKNWNIQELTLTTEEKKEAERPDQDAEEEGEGAQAAKKQAEEKSETADEGEGVSLSDTFTQQQIDETRREVQKEPTSDKTFKFRRSMLEYWHDQLLQEYKTLDLNGSDTITVEYTDLHGNQKDGEARKDTLGIASDANILCVGQDMTSPVMAVILGDEVRIKVVDPDMDSTNGPDSVQVMVSSIPKVAKAEEMSSLSVQVFAQEEEEQKMPELVPKDAPNFPTTLKETGEHTGVFTGSFSTLPAKPDAPEAKLGLSPERLVYVAYADARTATHPGEWAASARLEVVAGSKGEHEVIEMQDTQLDRRSELEKGVAMGKLARVYMDLGLRVDARRVFDEALKVVKAVVDAERGSPLGEEATYQMWDLYFASGDEIAAAEACAKLIATFPNSPLADDALLIMGKAEKKNIHAAMGHFSRLVQQYPDSDLAPEAAYLFADLKSKAGAFDVAAFEQVANKYPDSNFAAQGLLRLSEYYIENKDFARAKDYLERIALDFPDFNSLDKVTYMRGICAYRSGDVQLAYTLMHETIEKYPGTSVANSASKVVELLARKLKQ